MTAALIRLVALMALVLMPLGMAGAPAAASAMPADHHMAAGHCDGQSGNEQEAPAASMDCTAMCTAIPARMAVAPTPLFQRAAPRTVGIAIAFDSIEPEIATPPPRD